MLLKKTYNTNKQQYAVNKVNKNTCLLHNK